MNKTNQNPDVIEIGEAKPDCAPLGLLCLTVDEAKIIRKLLGDLPQSKVWHDLTDDQYELFCGTTWPKLQKATSGQLDCPCVICETPLKPSPTSRYWHKLPRGRGICYDCIFRFAIASLHGLQHETEERAGGETPPAPTLAAGRERVCLPNDQAHRSAPGVTVERKGNDETASND